MDFGHITRAVQSVFKKGGMDVKVTSTSFRKAAVTAVHSGNPALSGKLAWHMSHSESTRTLVISNIGNSANKV